MNGDQANDLRDRRDLLLDELSGLAQINYSEQPDKTITVYLGNHELVTSSTSRDVASVPDTANTGMYKLIFAGDGTDVTTTTGELRGVLDARDVQFPAIIARLNTLAQGFIGSINSVHQGGYGLDNSTGTPFFSGTAFERPVRDVGEAAGGVGNGSDVTFTQSDFTQQIAHGLCRLAGVGPMQAEA